MGKRPAYANARAHPPAPAAFEPTPQQLRMVIIASAAGTAFEWFDFFIFGTLASIIAKNFFTGVSDTTGLILALLVFAAGFVARPFGALVFGHFGDRIGRKGTFIVTISAMGLGTFLVGLLPTYAQVGLTAPGLLVGLRLLQGFAIGGEYGGAATYVAEHAPNGKRGYLPGWVQSSASIGLLGALGVVLLTRTVLGEDVFAAWGWRIPFLSSVILFLGSLYIRLKLGESPMFLRIREEGELAKAPLAESFLQWKNLKIALIALCSILIVQGTAWYTSHFYAQVFVEKTLKVPGATINEVLMIAVAASMPMYVFFGWLSDKIGRKPVMLFGILLGAVGFFPAFHMITEAANPALARAVAANPVTVIADPATCSLQFDPVGKAEFLTACDIAKSALTNAGVNYKTEAVASGAPTRVRIGSAAAPVADAAGATPSARAKARAAIQSGITSALVAAGYPKAADPAAIDFKRLVLIFVFFMVAATALYGPMAASLVELFPTRIRYSGLSFPYHLGIGWCGGFLPAIAFSIQAATGDIYAGLWYPVATSAFCFVFALLFLPETFKRDIA